MGKIKEWFPMKVAKIPKPVLFELVDNLTAQMLEVISPGKNKVTNKYDFMQHKDKETGKVSPYLVSILRTLFEGEMRQLPSLKGVPAQAVKDAAKKVVDSLLLGSIPSLSADTLLSEGKMKLTPLSYLLKKVVPETLRGLVDERASTEVIGELASAISRLDVTKGGYADSLIKVITGTYAREETEEYNAAQRSYTRLNTKGMSEEDAQQALLGRLGSSRVVYERLQKLVDMSWEGPVSVAVPVDDLAKVFTAKSAEDIEGRLRTIKHSELYNDEGRLNGAEVRLPAFPGASAPWNKGNEVLLSWESANHAYSIREGWHRVMAMVVRARKLSQPQFTLSAYVSTKADKSVLKELMDEIVKAWKLL